MNEENKVTNEVEETNEPNTTEDVKENEKAEETKEVENSEPKAKKSSNTGTRIPNGVNKGLSVKTLIIIIAVTCVAAIAIGVTVWAIFFRESDKTVLTPDYAPKETEKNAESMGDGGGTKLEAPEGGGAVSLIYSKNVTIDISDQKATLMFGNPSKSTQDMVVQIVIQDTIIAQSGNLNPGNKVTTLDLLDGKAGQLAAGGYEGKLVILYYNQESGERAMVNTDIPVTITIDE